MNTLELSLLITLIIWALGVLVVCLAMLFLIQRSKKSSVHNPDRQRSGDIASAILSAKHLMSVHPYLSGMSIPSLNIKQSIVIGYANVPTETSTPEQITAYPMQVMLFVYGNFNHPVIKLLTEKELNKLVKTVVSPNKNLSLDLKEVIPEAAFHISTYIDNVKKVLDVYPVIINDSSIWLDKEPSLLYALSKYTASVFKATTIGYFNPFYKPYYIPEYDALEILQKPEVLKCYWEHRNGQFYTIIGYAALYETRIDTSDVIYVVYANIDNGKIYTRPARDWLRSMTLIEDPNNVSKSKKILKAFRLFGGTD